ncbi:MAG: Gfo/Idh/MocA family protein [Chloroflexota bacterium]
MNICIVGYGSIAEKHVAALASEGVSFHSVTGRLAEPCADFARRYGFARCVPNLDEALADPAVDVVIVTSPTDLHAEHAAKALSAGKHVLCEIPLATNLANIDALITLAKRVDRRLMVCHTQRFLPGFARARAAIADGRLHVRHVIYRYGFLRRENVNWMGRRRSWTDNLLWHHGCHIVDTALWLLGATVVTVDAHLALPGPDLGVPMDLSMTLRTPEDQLITIGMSYNTHLHLDDCLLIGEEDTYMVEDKWLKSKDGVLHQPVADEMWQVAIVAQDREFLAAVRDGREPSVSARAIRPAMAVLQAAQDEYDAWQIDGVDR